MTMTVVVVFVDVDVMEKIAEQKMRKNYVSLEEVVSGRVLVEGA